MTGFGRAKGSLGDEWTAEVVAKRYAISREAQDKFAVASQNKAEAAQTSGRFKDEIAPVTVQSRKGDIVVDQDEYIRPGTTLDAVAKLKPAFSKDGTVTAGNASGVNDGAAALVIASEERARELEVEPLGAFVGSAVSGVDPRVMGIGPIPAVRRVLERVDGRRLSGHLVALREGGAGAGTALHVDDSVACDRIEPGSDGGTPLVVASGMLPRAGEDVLHDLLGQVTITECVAREAIELARVATVELAQIVAALVTGERLDKARVAAFHLVHGIRAQSLCGSKGCNAYAPCCSRRTTCGESPPARSHWPSGAGVAPP